MAELEQIAIERADAGVDPGGAAAGALGGAAGDDAVVVSVDGDGELGSAHRLRQPARDVHALERQNSAMLRLYPIKRRIVCAFSHGEDAAAIGLQQDLRRDLDHDVVARRHDNWGSPGG